MKTEQDKRISQATSFVKDLLEATKLDLEFRCDTEEEGMIVRLYGQDVGMVLGNGARLLYAINHILNRAFYEPGTEAFNLLVDCNDYRSARAEELESLARKAAEGVNDSGELYLFEPMPASERRVVHLALAEAPGVMTESEGSGLERRVVVLPAK
jgi:spoIIIJ-associated protein